MAKKIASAMLLFFCLMQINVLALPENIVSARDSVQSHKFEVSMSAANTADEITDYLNMEISELLSDDEVELYDVALTDFRAATSTGEGGYGSFSFVAELRYNGYRATTDILHGVINTSRVVITAASGSDTVQTGEALLLSAEAFEINSVEYQWYRADSKNNTGAAVIGENKKTYTPPTDEPYSAYFYCVCNGVRSNYMQIHVIPRFQPVERIELKNSVFYVGMPANINFNVFPENATNKDVVWSVYNSDGQAVMEKGKLIPIKPGKIILMAVIKNGLGENEDFAESFALNVQPEKTVVPDSIKLDPSHISGLSEAYSLNGKKPELAEMPKNDIRKAVTESGITWGKLHTVCGFSIIGEDVSCSFKLDGYNGEITLVTVNDGVYSSDIVDASDGIFHVADADSVIVLAEKEFEPAWLLTPMLSVPVIGLGSVIIKKRRK